MPYTGFTFVLWVTGNHARLLSRRGVCTVVTLGPRQRYEEDRVWGQIRCRDMAKELLTPAQEGQDNSWVQAGSRRQVWDRKVLRRGIDRALWLPGWGA